MSRFPVHNTCEQINTPTKIFILFYLEYILDYNDVPGKNMNKNKIFHFLYQYSRVKMFAFLKSGSQSEQVLDIRTIRTKSGNMISLYKYLYIIK